MDSEQWAYILSESVELWTQVGSRDDTIRQAASDAEYVLGKNAVYYVAPIKSASVSDFPPDADSLLDIVRERIIDECWKGAEPIDVSSAAETDLQSLLNDVWSLWVKRHKIEMPCFVVDLTRRETFGDDS